jgi:ATP-dependent DNA helicase RecQ
MNVMNIDPQKVPCNFYHAGLDADKRNKIQEEWVKKDGIIIATNAFGMGIDKPNVRFVINFGIPSSVEEWYQEIGRGSRDGKGCKCILIDNGDHIRKYLISIEYPPVREVRTFEQWLVRQHKAGRNNLKMTQERMALSAGVKPQFGGGCARFFLREGVIQKIKNGEYKILELKEMDYGQYELDKRDKEKDIENLKNLIDKTGCRMANFSHYFGDENNRKCECCDRCIPH